MQLDNFFTMLVETRVNGFWALFTLDNTLEQKQDTSILKLQRVNDMLHCVGIFAFFLNGNTGVCFPCRCPVEPSISGGPSVPGAAHVEPGHPRGRGLPGEPAGGGSLRPQKGGLRGRPGTGPDLWESTT